MRSLKLVALAVILALGSGVTGYALAARPTSAPAPAPTECAVPAPVAALPAVREPVLDLDPRPVPPAREEEPAPSRVSEVRARRIAVTHAIEDREPVDELDVVEDLAAGDRLYTFVDLANPGEATQVEVVFRHESGFTVGRVTLEVPAHVGRHRTWAYSSHLEEPGNWTALVRDASGRTLAAHAFEVR